MLTATKLISILTDAIRNGRLDHSAEICVTIPHLSKDSCLELSEDVRDEHGPNGFSGAWTLVAIKDHNYQI